MPFVDNQDEQYDGRFLVFPKENKLSSTIFFIQKWESFFYSHHFLPGQSSLSTHPIYSDSI